MYVCSWSFNSFRFFGHVIVYMIILKDNKARVTVLSI